MFTIKKKPLTPNIIWDGSAGKPLCNFGHKGTITTNDRDLAEKLAAMGHEVTGAAEAPAQQEPEQQDDGAENAQPEETAAPEPEKEPQAQAEQPGETAAEAPAQQAAAPTTKGRRNRK